MTQSESCHHVKADGVYCGSPALRERKYCYYHLMERARRLRRARALRDNVPYRLEIPPLDNLYAIRAAISDIAQALACRPARPARCRQASLRHPVGQLHQPPHREDGSRSREISDPNRRRAPHSRARSDLEWGFSCGSQGVDAAVSRLQEFPDFEEKLGLPPGLDLDVVIDAVERKADEEAKIRRAQSLPEPPPGIRPGSAAYRVFRDETYQMMRLQINDLRYQLRDYHEQKNQKLNAEIELRKKEATSATAAPTAAPTPRSDATNGNGLKLARRM